MTDREWDRVLREWATSEDPRRGEGCRGSGQPTEVVRDPGWYVAGEVETIDKIEAVVDGLPAREAFLLGQVVRYVDRAGLKDAPEVDLGKANNYAHRLVTGDWRADDQR